MSEPETRWVIREVDGGWFTICDRGHDGTGLLVEMARAFGPARAEVIRDALEASWPLEKS